MADMNLPLSPLGKNHIALNDEYGAHNYHPLPVVLARGKGEWVWDVDGKRYLDMLSAYSAVNQGHCHERLVQTLIEQSARITLTSRAFHNDQIGPWLKELTELCGMDRALPMNSGAEAVETSIKLARKWGYRVKGVANEKAEIVVCDSNFHGRTTMIVGFSSDPQYRADFGPFTGGFKVIPYGDSQALRAAITPNTVGFLVEPIQGEAGVIVPPAGYLEECDKICKENRVLFMADEIQTGLCRTGRLFCFQHEDCSPDLLILGKALGGGFYPISAVVGSDEVLGLLKPGDHGSTFGGNPLACAISRTALKILQDEELSDRAAAMGDLFRGRLQAALPSAVVKEVRGKGLLNAIELNASAGPARLFSEQLALRGVLAKETRSTTIRFAPPLVISDNAMNWALSQIEEVFAVRRG